MIVKFDLTLDVVEKLTIKARFDNERHRSQVLLFLRSLLVGSDDECDCPSLNPLDIVILLPPWEILSECVVEFELILLSFLKVILA